MKTKKVLLIQADTTQTLPMAKELNKKGYEVHAVVSEKLSYGYGCRYIKNKFLFKDFEDVDAYFKFLLPIIKDGNYNLLVPMADHGAIVVSKYRDELAKYSNFVMPEFIIFEEAYDKHKLMENCEELKLPHPRTVSIIGVKIPFELIDNLRFPVLIKPNHSCGARGITFIDNLEELKSKFPIVQAQYGDCHIQEFIPEGGAQVKVQIYLNENQDLVQSSVIHKYRCYPNKGGSSCCNKSIHNDKIVDICFHLLKEIGWVGFADFDAIEDPRTGELLIMELNPRVPACVKTPFAAGINWADVISSEYEGQPHKKYSMEKKIYLRHLGFEILWFLNAKNRFSVKPSWFKFFGKNIYYQDMNGWSDPLAFIFGTMGNIIKQLSPSFRKSKSGMN